MSSSSHAQAQNRVVDVAESEGETSAGAFQEAARTIPERAARRRPIGEQGERRVQLLLDTAEAVFGDVGFEAAHTKMIAARAGVSIGSLYQYFPDKAALFAAVAERYRGDLESAYARFSDLTGDEDWQQILGDLVDPIIQLELKHAKLKAILCDPAAGGREGNAFVREVERQIGHVLRRKRPHLSDNTVRAATKLSLAVMECAISNASSEEHAGSEIVVQSKQMLLSYLHSL